MSEVHVHPPVRQVVYHDVYQTNRVVDKTQRNRLCCHFWIVLLWSIGLAIPTGIFLFDVETRNTCYAPVHASDFNNPDRWVNVSRRFYVVLAIFFVFWIIEALRAILILLSTITRLHIISIVHTILCLNELLGLAAAVTLMLYRYQFSGLYCSCRVDPYCDQDNLVFDRDRPRLLVRRGRFLLGLTVCYWVFFAFNLLMHTVSLRKKDPVVV